jgi:hypothetical protein
MGRIVSRIRHAQPALFWSGVILLAAMLPSGLLAQIDERLLYGISVWVKPLKFQASSAVFLLTLAACFIALPPGADRTRAGRYVVWGAIATAFFEVGYISLQAARGQSSHWNFSSLFTVLMYQLMGVGALVLSSTAAVLGVMIARDRNVPIDATLRLGLVIGLVLSFVLGAGFGGVMAAGTGHWVGGTPSDAGGLPIFKWSRDGGDLRVAHFFGLHAMHFIPSFAWVIARSASTIWAKRATWAFGAVFAGFTTATFVQAWLGQPLLR